MRIDLYIRNAICLFLAWVAQVGATECTRKCTITNTDPACWNQSLDYYTETLAEALIEYSGTLMYLTRWQHTNPDESLNVTTLIQSAVARALQSHNDENNVLSAEDLQHIFNLTFSTSLTREDHYNDESTYLPLFACPIPCDYSNSVWRTVTILVSVAFVLCCACFFLYICRHDNMWNTNGNGKRR